jgi:V8-like Glu-specific endopeptidase
MPLRHIEGDDSSMRQEGAEVNAEDFGTVTRKRNGDVSNEPAGEEIKRSLEKQGSAAPAESAGQSSAGDVEPVPQPNRVEKKVVSSDERVQIHTTTDFPFRTIGLLEGRFEGSDDYYYCTGTVIAESHVLTAAHCLYNELTGKWADELTFFPGYTDPDAPYGAYDWDEVNVLAGYVKAGTGKYTRKHMLNDMGVVKLSKRAGNAVGWMGWGFDNGLPSFTANIVGYPLDKPEFTMWRTSCNIDTSKGDGKLFYNKCDIAAGYDGAALYDLDSSTDERTVYGEQVAEDGTQNIAVRITEAWFDWLDAKTQE